MGIACVSAMLPRQQITLIVKGKKMRGERKTLFLSPSLVHSFVEYQTACTPVCVNIIFPVLHHFLSFIALFCSVFFCCLKLKHHLILWSWNWPGLLSASAFFCFITTPSTNACKCSICVPLCSSMQTSNSEKKSHLFYQNRKSKMFSHTSVRIHVSENFEIPADAPPLAF